MRERLTSTLPTPPTTMGVYKLSIEDLDRKLSSKSPQAPFPKSSFLRGTATAFMGRRFSTKVQPTLRSFLESPDIEPASLPAVDPISSSSEDDNSSYSSHFTASSTRTPSHFLTSDEDACLRELSNSLRGGCRGGFENSGFASLARHSTACCTDGAVRQELRRKFHLEDTTSSVRVRNSFAMGRCSFRRELDTTEDRVESLALWEESPEFPLSTSVKERVVRKDWNAAQSWPQGQATSPLVGFSGKLGLDSLFRKPKKATSSFFSGFFSRGLSFSKSRRSRKTSSY